MNKASKVQFICSNCSAVSPRWQGKCPSCGEWNTLAESVVAASRGKGAGALGRPKGEVVNLRDSKNENRQRFTSGIGEFDLVLGGGFVQGSLVLLGGDPGVGKSTLALQSALLIKEKNIDVLYISGEESAHQLYSRAERLSRDINLNVLNETSLEEIMLHLESNGPSLAIIDSIQTITSSEVNGVTGGVSQVAFVTNSLMRLAKQLHITLLIIGHVTKEGMLAGPKTLEHMVDTVLYLEGERFSGLRILRCQKNRFGSTGEVGVFEMKGGGLAEVKNPGAVFLEQRTSGIPGTCVAAVLEGNKTLLLEVQALTNPSGFGYPKRASSGFDNNRLQLLLAIMEKRLGVKVASQDVYINVAGGFDLQERAADLPVVLAILSSLKNKPVPENLVAFGEVGLAGEVRSVTQGDKRMKEASKLGFSEVMCGGKLASTKETKVHQLKFISELKEWL